MKLILALATGVALYGGTHLFHGGGQNALAAPDPSRDEGVYRLVADGVENCRLTRGAVRPDGSFPLTLDPGCDALLPGIARATRWREGTDGTVTFGRDDGEKVVAFSIADGEGYLSYAPATPLLSLSAE